MRELDEASMAPDDDEFSARMNTYDLAFKMQTEAPAVFDISREPKTIQDSYGIGNEITDDYGRRCLLARRLVEKGVRFVTVVSGGPAISQWDAHDDIEENHLRMAARVDQPIAALLKRFEAAWIARFDTGGLGRRVRSYSRSARRQRARSQ